MKINLDAQVRQACRHLLSEINRDPASESLGCFDRRYWAWKLSDFPEATFQRNLANLTWYGENCVDEVAPGLIHDVVLSGLLYTANIQHPDGSFDQAFPFDRSFGATGFLLPDLIKAYMVIKDQCTNAEKECIEKMLNKAAAFLCANMEKHALISNHLAGAALGLMLAAGLFNNLTYEEIGRKLVEYIVSNQSAEGWFPEYDGADPGYQTLCMNYLSQIYRLSPSETLKKAIDQSLNFLQYFVHPDGTFGGEYGSRRTEVYYPGGIALLAGEFPQAAVIHQFMKNSIENLNTVSLIDIDMGNMAPLLSSSILALESSPEIKKSDRLPFEQGERSRCFSEAGLAIFGNPSYYAVIGASNGGVIKVFDQESRQLIWDDCGALAETRSGVWLTTQSTNLENPLEIDNDVFTICSNFSQVIRRKTTPFNYLILRILNLSVMRIRSMNELIKKIMVAWLVKPKQSDALNRRRTIEFSREKIKITDTYDRSGSLRLMRLFDAGKFNAIHMASSRYFSGNRDTQKTNLLDHEALNRDGKLQVCREIDLKRISS